MQVSCTCNGEEIEYVEAARTLTPEQAKRLADHYMALAQIYREIAGLKPIPTAAHQRKIAGR